MLNHEIIIKRLALIKQLYRIGVEQSRQFETIASFFDPIISRCHRNVFEIARGTQQC